MKNILLLCLFVATSCNAYSIAGYKGSIEKLDKTGDEMLRLAIDLYHTGIAEAVHTLQKSQGGTIFNEGRPFICIPGSVTIDKFMIESIMRNQLDNLGPFRELYGDKYADYAAFQLAYVGLWRSFPCTAH